jgi:uncharacterized protein YhbP (UPF0306 family)
MEDRILKYLEQQIVFTIATSVDEYPYCANCFYSYHKASQSLLFLSDATTRHIREAIINPHVAGTIQNGVTSVAKLQGIQFQGNFSTPSTQEQKVFYANYYDKFPFAKGRPAAIWSIQLTEIKMTDNTLGFGKKVSWKRN